MINYVFTCTMFSSVHNTDGIKAFASVAKRLPFLQFDLLLFTAEPSLRSFKHKEWFSKNLKSYTLGNNINPFLKRSAVLLEMGACQEYQNKVDLALAQGLRYGKPLICTSPGLPYAAIEHRKNGFHVQSHNLGLIQEYILILERQPKTYEAFSQAAQSGASKFAKALSRHRQINTSLPFDKAS